MIQTAASMTTANNRTCRVMARLLISDSYALASFTAQTLNSGCLEPGS